jgi:hypothetical protein
VLVQAAIARKATFVPMTKTQATKARNKFRRALRQING